MLMIVKQWRHSSDKATDAVRDYFEFGIPVFVHYNSRPIALASVIHCIHYLHTFGHVSYVRDRAWFVRLYGEITPELYRGDYRPYRRTNHALSHLYHNNQFRPCTLRSVSC